MGSEGFDGGEKVNRARPCISYEKRLLLALRFYHHHRYQVFSEMVSLYYIYLYTCHNFARTWIIPISPAHNGSAHAVLFWQGTPELCLDAVVHESTAACQLGHEKPVHRLYKLE